jgi:hypothetical protein
VTVTASSSTYDTDPVGDVLEQPEFLNACVRIETALGPEDLLDACKAVEAELGGPGSAPPSTCTTARGRSTSTSCCSAIRSTTRPGCACRTPRCWSGGSC